MMDDVGWWGRLEVLQECPEGTRREVFKVILVGIRITLETDVVVGALAIEDGGYAADNPFKEIP